MLINYMGAWCGRFALTTSRENFTTTEKVCENNSWCRIKIDDSRKLQVKFKWLPFFDNAKINKCVLLYKTLQGESPMYINDLLITNKSLHGRETRHGQQNFVCPTFRHITEVGRSSSVSSI